MAVLRSLTYLFYLVALGLLGLARGDVVPNAYIVQLAQIDNVTFKNVPLQIQY